MFKNTISQINKIFDFKYSNIFFAFIAGGCFVDGLDTIIYYTGTINNLVIAFILMIIYGYLAISLTDSKK